MIVNETKEMPVENLKDSKLTAVTQVLLPRAVQCFEGKM
jgi:hypothetical protein